MNGELFCCWSSLSRMYGWITGYICHWSVQSNPRQSTVLLVNYTTLFDKTKTPRYRICCSIRIIIVTYDLCIVFKKFKLVFLSFYFDKS